MFLENEKNAYKVCNGRLHPCFSMMRGFAVVMTESHDNSMTAMTESLGCHCTRPNSVLATVLVMEQLTFRKRYKIIQNVKFL
jgi:hypothetical protein